MVIILEGIGAGVKKKMTHNVIIMLTVKMCSYMCVK